MATTYALPSEVLAFLRLRSATGRLTLSATSDPATDELSLAINIAEDEIDRITGHAWRSVTVTSEFHDVPFSYNRRFQYEISIPLNHRAVRNLASGDKIEIWDGSSWVDVYATKTQGRNNDYWVDYTNGIIYFRAYRPVWEERGVCITYRYGESTVPKDIQKAAILLAAIDLVENDTFKSVLPQGIGQDPLLAKTERWRADVERILAHRREIFHGFL